MAGVNIGTIKDLKEGRFVVIDNEPCRIVRMDISKPGKHGSAKARIDAISLFTGNKKTLVKPVDASVEIPIIEKRAAQVIADLGGGRYQLMDLQSYETYEIEIPEEWRAKAQPGTECEIHEVMGRKLFIRVK